jgi:hypothetical protein
MIQPLTRAGIWVLFVLALLNGVFLYFLPAQAEEHYAWSVTPPVNAAFIGAGFLAGTLATGLVLRYATQWRTFSTLPVALWVLATALLVATLIHADRFKWDYPPTWVWALVYGGVPLAVPYLVWRQRSDEEPYPHDPGLLYQRVISAVLGAGLLIFAAWVFSSPDPEWPWQLTPLLGRAVAAWYALFGTMLVSCAIGLRTFSAALIPYATLACWSILLALLPLLHPDDVSGAGLWLAACFVLLAHAVTGIWLGWRERDRL